MAQKTYSLYHSETVEGDQQLVAEIGATHLALVLGTQSKISGFEYFDADDNDLEALLSFAKENSLLLDKSYSETKLFYNLEESVLVPSVHFNSSVASEFLDIAFGDKAASRINVENINVQPGIVNVYRSDSNWQNIITHYFRAVTKRHLFSRLIETVPTNCVKVQFYNHEMIVVAANNQLQLARRFEISTDEDAVYHLLNACKQTAIDPLNTTLEVSGLINTESQLFQLLKQYFGEVQLQNANENILPQQELLKYPLHYFTPFFNLLQ